jgi:predicted nucleic acid-binding protein
MANDSRITVISASRDLLRKGLELYESRLDRGWSLTDWFSIIVMQENGLADVLSSDHHFEQSEFRILM